MPESTGPVPQPTDEQGTPLTDAEIAAVIRARPLLLLVALSNPLHDISVAGGGMQVLYRAGDGLGQVTVSRSVIVEAMERTGA